tara:strand:+ start:204 stop:395 length:192 start_codon:yes stop_codon:yes gene_type:complete
LKKSRKEGRNQVMTIMAYMKKHLVLPGESFIQEYKSVPPEGREALKEYAREEMEHKGIEIDGE